jgi:hypothetical protein
MFCIPPLLLFNGLVKFEMGSVKGVNGVKELNDNPPLYLRGFDFNLYFLVCFFELRERIDLRIIYLYLDNKNKIL